MNSHVAEPFRSALNAQIVDGEAVDYSTCPKAHREAMRLWVEHRVYPGAGLTMVLSHDLQAVVYCDEETVKMLPALVRWIYNHTPSLCHGSRERVEAWGKARRAER